MRVAYDYQVFNMQQYGGVSRYFVELAKAVSGLPDVSVKVISPLHINAYLADAAGSLSVVGRHVPALRYTGRFRGRVNRLLAPRLLARSHADLVHETYYSADRIAPAGSKTVLTVCDMIHELFPDSFPPGHALSASTRKRLAVERADQVICISEHTRKDLVAIMGLDAAKTSVVHLGVSPPKPPVFQVKGAGRPFLLYVGHRGGHKNFVTLLRAYAANEALQREYDVVTFGGGALTEGEFSLLRELGVDSKKVRQTSGDDAVLVKLYRTAALLVYPSHYEGFGMPPLEAMSLDCPVVCSNASSIPEVVGDAAELFDPDSAVDLSAAVERVLNDSSLRLALIERGREHVKLFSWERCARQTLDVYKGVLS